MPRCGCAGASVLASGSRQWRDPDIRWVFRLRAFAAAKIGFLLPCRCIDMPASTCLLGSGRRYRERACALRTAGPVAFHDRMGKAAAVFARLQTVSGGRGVRRAEGG